MRLGASTSLKVLHFSNFNSSEGPNRETKIGTFDEEVPGSLSVTLALVIFTEREPGTFGGETDE